jgi:hypothetical protein
MIMYAFILSVLAFFLVAVYYYGTHLYNDFRIHLYNDFRINNTPEFSIKDMYIRMPDGVHPAGSLVYRQIRDGALDTSLGTYSKGLMAAERFVHDLPWSAEVLLETPEPTEDEYDLPDINRFKVINILLAAPGVQVYLFDKETEETLVYLCTNSNEYELVDPV